MTRMLPILLFAAACGANATPAGSTIVKWKLDDADRVPIRTGLVADVKTFEREVVTHPVPETPVKLRVRVEAAKVTWHEGDETLTRYAPVAVSAKVIDGAGYRFRDVVCNGPAGSVDHEDARGVMFVQCRVKTTKPEVDVELRLRIAADGTVAQG